MKVTIRNCQDMDIEQVAWIEQNTFSEPWTKEGFLETLAQPHPIFMVAEEDNVICGYGILYCNSDEGEIPTIAVASDKRGCGIGKLLLDAMLTEADTKGVKHVYLEVRKGNLAAQRLYEHCGFSCVGMRKNFYQKPVEDALVMAFHKEDIC